MNTDFDKKLFEAAKKNKGKRQFLGVWDIKTHTIDEIYKEAMHRAKIVKAARPKKEKVISWITRHMHAIGFVWLFFLVMGTSALAMGINPLGVSGISDMNLTGINPTATPTTEPTSEQTSDIEEETTYQEQQQIQKTSVNSDPIIDCKFAHAGIKPMKKSECNISNECVIDGNYYIYNSEAKCRADQAAYWSKKNGGTANSQTTSTYQSPNYPPCTIHYSSWDHTYSGMSPDWCRSEQARVDAVNNWGTSTTAQIPQEPVQVVDNRYRDCIDDATINYNAAQQRARAQYGGGSSTGDAIIQIAKQDYDRAVQSCNQYPH